MFDEGFRKITKRVRVPPGGLAECDTCCCLASGRRLGRRRLPEFPLHHVAQIRPASCTATTNDRFQLSSGYKLYREVLVLRLFVYSPRRLNRAEAREASEATRRQQGGTRGNKTHPTTHAKGKWQSQEAEARSKEEKQRGKRQTPRAGPDV